MPFGSSRPIVASFLLRYCRTRPSNFKKDLAPARVNIINNLRELGVNHPVNGRQNTRNGLHMLGFSTARPGRLS